MKVMLKIVIKSDDIDYDDGNNTNNGDNDFNVDIFGNYNLTNARKYALKMLIMTRIIRTIMISVIKSISFTLELTVMELVKVGPACTC